MRAPGQPRQPGLLTVGDLLGSEQHQKIPLRPALTLGAVDQNAPHAPRIRQLQPFEQRIDPRRRDHDRRPTRREDTPPVLGRVRARRCAPALRAPSAAWTRPARHSPFAVSGRGPSRLVERERRHCCAGQMRVYS